MITKKEQKEYEDYINYRYEKFRTIFFNDCPHAGKIATPHGLCEEMIEKLPDLNGKLVLVLFNPEFYLTILRKYPAAKIVMVTGSENAYCIQKENGFKGIEHMILANPFNLDEIEKAIGKYEKFKGETHDGKKKDY